MNIKVSVIVPVYNAQETLSSCLGNLVHQTLPEIELILVNDASTDNSLNILLDCEQAFPDKVIVVNLTQNSGPGGARNVGISYASGEYIGFVDSDDLPDVQMYEKLYHLARSGQYDMVDGAYYNANEDQLILQTGDNCKGFLNAQKRSELIVGGGYLWSRIVKRSFFDHLCFRENCILEDMEILMLLFMKCKNIGTTREVVYQYNATAGSASKVSDAVHYQKAITGAMVAVAESLIYSRDYSDVQKAVEYSIVHLYQCGIINAMNPENHLNATVQRAYLKELQRLRFQYVHIPYAQNPYICQKIAQEDLKLMKQVDQM